MNQDFLDLLRAFADAEVRFLVVGAYALGLHGKPRATGDLDLWIDATPENARRVMQALGAFGAPMADIAERDFARPGVTYQIGLPPRRIDILTELTGRLSRMPGLVACGGRSAASTWTTSAGPISFGTNSRQGGSRTWRTSRGWNRRVPAWSPFLGGGPARRRLQVVPGLRRRAGFSTARCRNGRPAPPCR